MVLVRWRSLICRMAMLAADRVCLQAAIMNPNNKVLALKSGQQLQIFNLDLRAKMKSHSMPAPVVFWRWVTPSLIVLVTATSVFFTGLEGIALQ